jgi:hypothetical protein
MPYVGCRQAIRGVAIRGSVVRGVAYFPLCVPRPLENARTRNFSEFWPIIGAYHEPLPYRTRVFGNHISGSGSNLASMRRRELEIEGNEIVVSFSFSRIPNAVKLSRCRRLGFTCTSLPPRHEQRRPTASHWLSAATCENRVRCDRAGTVGVLVGR